MTISDEDGTSYASAVLTGNDILGDAKKAARYALEQKQRADGLAATIDNVLGRFDEGWSYYGNMRQLREDLDDVVGPEHCRECSGSPESCRRSRIKCCPDCTHTAEQVR